MIIESSPYIGVALQRTPELILRAVGFTADPWQRRILRSKSNTILLCCHRQSGKSWTCAGLAVNTALLEPYSLTIIISAAQRQSDELYGKILRLYRANGEPIPIVKQTATELALENGSRVVSLPDSPDTIVSFSSPKLIIIDEASRCSDESIGAVLPMRAASRGRLVALSTPKGRRGWFHKVWFDHSIVAERVLFRGVDDPRLDPKFLDDEKAIGGDLYYRQEYNCEFLDYDEQLFSSELIDSCFTSPEPPLFPV